MNLVLIISYRWFFSIRFVWNMEQKVVLHLEIHHRKWCAYRQRQRMDPLNRSLKKIFLQSRNSREKKFVFFSRERNVYRVLLIVITPKLCNAAARCTCNMTKRKNYVDFLYVFFFSFVRLNLGIRNMQPANKWSDLLCLFCRYVSRCSSIGSGCNISNGCSFSISRFRPAQRDSVLTLQLIVHSHRLSHML